MDGGGGGGSAEPSSVSREWKGGRVPFPFSFFCSSSLEILSWERVQRGTRGREGMGGDGDGFGFGFRSKALVGGGPTLVGFQFKRGVRWAAPETFVLGTFSFQGKTRHRHEVVYKKQIETISRISQLYHRNIFYVIPID
jgi:hypothetical protein